MELISHAGGAKALLELNLPGHAVGLAWLGQAGFALRHAHHRLLIDPYLSDHLACKYAGTEFPHIRMMPPPLEAGAVRDLDLVLCSHRHSDHTDPGSLPTLARNNPGCRFVVPRAEMESVLQLGLDEAQLVPANDEDVIHVSDSGGAAFLPPSLGAANDGDAIRVSDSLVIHVIPSAHETLQVNARGEHRFLGFILKVGEFTLYHSGDCVVYDGLAQRLGAQRIDLALLPVNGRSERLTSRGIAGNMTFEEASNLCRAAHIRALIPHHFGMFEFNTADPRELQRQIARLDPATLFCVLPEVDRYYLLA